MAVSSFKRHGPNLKARRLEIQLMGLVWIGSMQPEVSNVPAHAAHAAHLRQKPPEAGCKPSLAGAGHKVGSLSRKIGQRLELGNSNSSYVSVSRCQPVSTCECHLWMLPVVIAGGARSTSSLMEVGCKY